MIVGERIKARLEALDMSQSELARRVQLTQGTIGGLIIGKARSSAHLHKIARELGTTPAYLIGETDDPDKDAPPPRPPSTIQHILMPIALPGEDALAEMFAGLLEAIGPKPSADEIARELAQLLPSVLTQLRGQLVATPPPPPRAPAAAAGARPSAAGARAR